MRHGLTEFLHVHQIEDVFVGIVIHGDDPGPGVIAAAPHDDAVIARFLVFQHERHIQQVHIAHLHIQLAGDALERDQFGCAALRNLDIQPVNIRQLIAFGIDLPVVGVPVQHQALAGDIIDGHPGGERRSVRIVHATAEVVAVDQFGGVLGVAVRRVKAAHIVLGHDMNRRVVGAARFVFEEERVGVGEAEVQGVVVDLFH